MSAFEPKILETELDRTPTPEEEWEDFQDPDHRRRHLENEKLREEIALRQQYAKTSKRFALGWTLFSGIMALLQFCKPWGKHLEQAEFIALVATALATVIALYIQVGRGIFSGPP